MVSDKEIRKYARKSEKDFSELCTDFDVSCNPSLEDDFGWDHILDFPAKKDPRGRLETSTAQHSAKVQIKSIIGEKMGIQLRLSNLNHFVKSPLPCFFVVYKYDLLTDAVEKWVLHFDADWMAKSLKRIRECEVKKKKPLHKSQMTIPLNAMKILEEQEIIPFIESFLDDDYATKKIDWAKHAGYEGGFARIELNASFEDEDALINFSLGIKPELNVSELRHFDTRFGIEEFRPDLSFKNIVMSYQVQPSDHIDMIIHWPDGGEEKLPTEVITDVLPPESLEEARVRFRNAFFDLTVHWGGLVKLNVETISDFQKARPLEELDIQAKFLKYLRQTSKFRFDLLYRDGSADEGEVDFHKFSNWEDADQFIEGLRFMQMLQSRLKEQSLSYSFEDIHPLSAKAWGYLRLKEATDLRVRGELALGTDCPQIDEAIGFGLLEGSGSALGFIARFNVIEQKQMNQDVELQLGDMRISFAKSGADCEALVKKEYERILQDPNVMFYPLANMNESVFGMAVND